MALYREAEQVLQDGEETAPGVACCHRLVLSYKNLHAFFLQILPQQLTWRQVIAQEEGDE